MCLDHIDYTHTCPFAPCEACVQLPLRAFLACQAPFVPTLFSHKYLLLFLSTTNVFVGFSKVELSKAQRCLLRMVRRHSSAAKCSPRRSVHSAFPIAYGVLAVSLEGPVYTDSWPVHFRRCLLTDRLFPSELVLMLSLHFHGYHVDQIFM